MRLLQDLLRQDPATPRVTIYEEDAGNRLDFSAQTLDNWAAKVANMLREELELEPGDPVSVDLPVSWQSIAISLGCVAAELDLRFDHSAEVLFCDSKPENYDGEVVLVSSDPFGRGISELGKALPDDCIDFGPTVRFFGDHFPEEGPSLAAWAPPREARRHLSTGWNSLDQMRELLGHLSAGGSLVIVRGPASPERIAEIARAERAE
ncbi:TIGR03089 family protein [Corynebacterium gerontici]|uniref:TIGR03089 family protein n=1 Tax=Corynebacterium gerontici TaxID=2079234 RepID=A0A3G6IYK2_9CORY|nr:TIGR03089 family protein [Corynebacterium gerontici]AZA10855.1 hypothetical protein CGERO_02655 [Corynebacterium gerontici]